VSPGLAALALIASSGGVAAAAGGEAWVRFTSQECGFAIDRPEEAQVRRVARCEFEIVIPLHVPAEQGGGYERFIYRVSAHPNPARLAVSVFARTEFAVEIESTPESVLLDRSLRVGNARAFEFVIAQGDEDRRYVFVDGKTRIYELQYADPTSLTNVAPGVRQRWLAILSRMTASFRL
jgi:hypothetical protein